jgi:potassium-dependent mechanosensitive channel
MVLLLFPANLYSQEVKGVPSVATNQYDALINSVDAALVSEGDNIERLKTQLDETKSLEKSIAIDLNAYRAQSSSHGNLLLLPETRIEALEKTKIENLSAIEAVSLQLNNLTDNLSSVNQIRKQAEEQYALNEKQLSEIKQSGQKNEKTRILTKNLRNLLQVIAAKKNLLDQTAALYSEQISRLEESQKALLSLSEKFDRQLKEKKREVLFERKSSPFGILQWKRVGEDIRELAVLGRSLFSAEAWKKQIKANREYLDFHFIILLFLLTTIIVLLVRLGKFCAQKEQAPFLSRFPRRYAVFHIFCRSVVFIGIAAFFYMLRYADLSWLTPSTTRTVTYILTIWLSTKWWLDFLDLSYQDQVYPVMRSITRYLRFIVIVVRYYSVGYIIVAWIIGGERSLLVLSRTIFELALFLWYLLFVRSLQHASLESSRLPATVSLFLNSFLRGIGYVVVGAGLVLDLIGYGSFALYWTVSWGRTAVIVLWGFLLFRTLKEWGQQLKQVAHDNVEETAKHAYPIRWFLNRLCWLLWLVAFLLSASFGWGARQAIIISSIHILNRTISIGSLSFSLMSLFYAFLILFFTLAGTRIWRNFLNTKILTESLLEPGLKESIETISVYLFWGIGMVIALNIMGVSSTSMAVVFGALSIGLGFGLQNIFNNFISGIILLFERPIQVGDAVELNGIWGEVKKINVRATVVQTYDNASLIIPNSEFISSQVTNWSFKDLRLRRKVTVGVAYGSDIELVRKTLLEVADNNQLVLKVPKPDVLFSDFGDSALIFVLRIWTDVNRMWICETNIRFEIDRLFHERGIEISFPQRDIHIRSITGDDKLSIESGEKPRI